MNNVVINRSAALAHYCVTGYAWINGIGNIEHLIPTDVRCRIGDDDSVGNIFNYVTEHRSAAINADSRVALGAPVENTILNNSFCRSVVKGNPTRGREITAGNRILDAPSMNVTILNGDIRSTVNRNAASGRPGTAGIHCFIPDFKVTEK